MKTIEQVKRNYKCRTLDGRDLLRLAQFLSANDLEHFGIELKDGTTEEEYNSEVKEFTRENILAQLEKDVEFGFEKALDKRGISAGMMYEVVSMWNWILEEGLEDFDEYEHYGLPLFKATAEKYGFNNPIGEDIGSEEIYGD
jgi:hypothetical protein